MIASYNAKQKKLQKGSTEGDLSRKVDLCLLPLLAYVLGLLLCLLCSRAAVRLLIFFNWIVVICLKCRTCRISPTDTEAPIQYSRRTHLKK